MSWLKRPTPRERLLSRGNVSRELFEGWGVPFYIKGVNAALFLQFNERLFAASKDGASVADAEALRMIAELITRVCVGEDWNPIFGADDIDALLAQYTVDEMQKVIDISLRLSGVTTEQMEKAKAQLKKARKSNSHMN